MWFRRIFGRGAAGGRVWNRLKKHYTTCERKGNYFHREQKPASATYNTGIYFE